MDFSTMKSVWTEEAVYLQKHLKNVEGFCVNKSGTTGYTGAAGYSGYSGAVGSPGIFANSSTRTTGASNISAGTYLNSLNNATSRSKSISYMGKK